MRVPWHTITELWLPLAPSLLCPLGLPTVSQYLQMQGMSTDAHFDRFGLNETGPTSQNLAVDDQHLDRSEERHVGNEGVSTRRSRRSPFHSKINTIKKKEM